MKKLFEVVYILAHTSGTHTIFTLFAHISPSKFLKESKYKYKLYIYIYIIYIYYIYHIYIYIYKSSIIYIKLASQASARAYLGLGTQLH